MTGTAIAEPMAAPISASTRRAYAGALHSLDARLDGYPLDDAALAECLKSPNASETSA